MPIKNPKELFVRLLSGAWSGTERTAQLYQELSQSVQDPDIREAFEARAFIFKQDLASIEQCFKVLGEQPVKMTSRLYDVFAEDFRKELGDIQSPVAKIMFVLAKANHLNHLRIAGYEALIAAADKTGHYSVGVLLESCLADKVVFAERTKRLIRNIVKTQVAEKLAA